MKRRTYLGVVALALAGCSSDGDNAGPGDATTGTDGNAGSTTSEGGSDPILFDGSGETTTDTFELEGGIAAFDMEHAGDGGFQVELVDQSSGNTVEFVANEMGQWRGRIPYGVDQGTYALAVTAVGDWSVEISQPRQSGSDADQPPLSFSGESPDYEGPVEFSGETTFAGSYASNGVFNVAVLDPDGNSTSVFSEMRSFEGEESVEIDGTGWIRVVTNGEWEVEVE
ncbi:hypothetical protein G9464_06655 [Halostella sp. JP-L12]|uniref:hypothetical protein n=1 Tax=Halostella TaxID=1843185 RepID=UPI000EF7AD5F|nr:MULTISPECIES: hypothetical protein [Halostella]NHN47278.1 hypothetical protein [Halostella sp. JP-L12]